MWRGSRAPLGWLRHYGKRADTVSGEKETGSTPISPAAGNSVWFFSQLICQVFPAVTVLSHKPLRVSCPGDTVIAPSPWLKQINLLQLFSKPDPNQARQQQRAFCSSTPNYFNIHSLALSGLTGVLPLTFWRHTKNWITFSPRTWLQPHHWRGSFQHFKGPEVCDNMALQSRISPGNGIRRFILFLIFERFQKAFNWISH